MKAQPALRRRPGNTPSDTPARCAPVADRSSQPSGSRPRTDCPAHSGCRSSPCAIAPHAGVAFPPRCWWAQCPRPARTSTARPLGSATPDRWPRSWDNHTPCLAPTPGGKRRARCARTAEKSSAARCPHAPSATRQTARGHVPVRPRPRAGLGHPAQSALGNPAQDAAGACHRLWLDHW